MYPVLYCCFSCVILHFFLPPSIHSFQQFTIHVRCFQYPSSAAVYYPCIQFLISTLCNSVHSCTHRVGQPVHIHCRFFLPSWLYLFYTNTSIIKTHIRNVRLVFLFKLSLFGKTILLLNNSLDLLHRTFSSMNDFNFMFFINT